MNLDSLQHLVPEEREDLTRSPDFRFTNYAFAPQRLVEKPLPQDVPSEPSAPVRFHNALDQGVRPI